jgi:hypothetical protein
MFSDHGSPSLEGNLMADTPQADHSINLERSSQAGPEGSARTKVSRKSDCHLSLGQQALENFQGLSQQVHHDVDERRHLVEEVYLTLQKALQELQLVRKSMEKVRWKIRGAPRRGPHRSAGLPHLATPHPHRPSPAFYTPRKSILTRWPTLA